MKITSMETVSTGVLDENKEHYLRSKDKAEKSYVLRHVQLHLSKYKKNDDLQSIISNLQPNCCLILNMGENMSEKWILCGSLRPNNPYVHQ